MKTSKIQTCKSFEKECRTFFYVEDIIKRHKNDNRIEFLDIDNILNFNEGYVNLIFNGDDCSESFLFLDGVYDSTSYTES